MNILFVSGHPAQVHNFRLVREQLIRDGHQVYWLTTKKDIATNLLDTYGIPYGLLQKPKKGIWSKVKAIVRNVWFECRYLRQNKIDLCITRTCPYTSVAAWLLHIPHIIVDDTEHAAASIFQQPFARLSQTVMVPDCFYYTIRKSQLRFAGNIELFYLHPNRFHLQAPWEMLGIEPETQYAVVRFVKWDAYHDTKLVGGLSLEQKRQLVKRLSEHMRVFITSETPLPEDLEPYRIQIPIERMHDALACASLFVGESATMASESVALGTPAVYIDEVGRGYTDEEAREGLLWMYRPVANRAALHEGEPAWISGGVEECIEQAVSLAAPDFDRAAWQQRHKAWLSEKIDCTAWLTWMIERYPQSAEEYRSHRTEIEKRFKLINGEW